jgi:hypothetical protein
MSNEKSPFLNRIANRFPNLNEKQLEFFAQMEQELVQKDIEWESHYNDHDFYINAIKKREKALRRIPKEIWENPDFCLKAVKAWGASFDYIPEKLLTPELCLAAAAEDGESLYYISEKLYTEELCLAAVRQNGLALYYVPPLRMTKKIMQEALRQNSNALQYLNEDWREDGKEFLKKKNEKRENCNEK